MNSPPTIYLMKSRYQPAAVLFLVPCLITKFQTVHRGVRLNIVNYKIHPPTSHLQEDNGISHWCS